MTDMNLFKDDEYIDRRRCLFAAVECENYGDGSSHPAPNEG